ncbi:ECF RNA polymerase sigma factor RpoE [Sulfitobacter sp. THAF37]|uniref:RNA polymerase sigma factor n=1 Tax=Sulfitobacter sp. THAF37 TaxID=2587855 RepID=UPI001267E025|nr:RNA polymerase sigma factor [Sulfitobacter sp. THAF37]QFT59712.1 ECF RNA polymerase sigma factor RpoE [Sulfitobacter sp. THAF37]
MTETAATPCALSPLLPRLRARARRLTRSAEEAEDLAQEVALKMWQLLAEDTRIDAPDRYAMIMLHNLARYRWRGARRTEELTEDMVVTAPLGPARLACAELRAAIARLPRDQRACMEMIVAGDTSPQVLAAKLRVPQGTVMSRLARARASLRQQMALEGSVTELL